MVDICGKGAFINNIQSARFNGGLTEIICKSLKIEQITKLSKASSLLVVSSLAQNIVIAARVATAAPIRDVALRTLMRTGFTFTLSVIGTFLTECLSKRA
mgnify:CR=1 FL=1